MDQNGLTQADLAPLFGTKSIVSEVLSGKRALSKTHHPAQRAFWPTGGRLPRVRLEFRYVFRLGLNHRDLAGRSNDFDHVVVARDHEVLCRFDKSGARILHGTNSVRVIYKKERPVDARATQEW
jgi:hypothetical protein